MVLPLRLTDETTRYTKVSEKLPDEHGGQLGAFGRISPAQENFTAVVMISGL
jgi:hypothetical protein